MYTQDRKPSLSASHSHARNASASSSLDSFSGSLYNTSPPSFLDSLPYPSYTSHDISADPHQMQRVGLEAHGSSGIDPSYTHRSHSSHSRHSSISSTSSRGSERSHSHDKGVSKRTTSARRARESSVPYSRDHIVDPKGEKDDADELAHMFAQAGVGGEYGITGKGEEWGGDFEVVDSRRSSMSSALGWDEYDPSLGGAAGRRGVGETRGGSAYDPAESQEEEEEELEKLQHAGVDPEEVRNTLEECVEEGKKGNTASAFDKARSAFVQTWLGASYSRCDEGNVSRQALFGSYQKACAHYGVKDINSASFGKAVRQKFPEIKTRRLGVRGASRYHYCGLEPTNIDEAVLLAQLVKEEQGEVASPVDASAPARKSVKPRTASRTAGRDEFGGDEDEDHSDFSGYSVPINPGYSNNLQPPTPTTARPHLSSQFYAQSSMPMPPLRRASSKFGLSIFVPPAQAPLTPGGTTARPDVGGSASGVAGFPSVAVVLASAGVGVDLYALAGFWERFEEHCRGLLEHVRGSRFDLFEMSTRMWWAALDPAQRSFVMIPTISTLIYRADAAIYDDILELLHSRILLAMPAEDFEALQSLSDNMEKIQSAAMESYVGFTFPGPKIELAARFGHLVSRHLGLRQLAQALRGIVEVEENFKEVVEAWDLIDFEAIKNQSALVSNCEHDLMSECFDGFRRLLRNHDACSMEGIVRWADSCFEKSMAPSSDGQRTVQPRSLLLRWSFVTSQIMRDLILRSAPSFGSFQILSLFFDEFFGFQVLRKVALQISAISSPTSTSLYPSQPTLFSPLNESSNASYPLSLSLPFPQPSSSSSDYLQPSSDYPQPLGTDAMMDSFSPNTRMMFETVARGMNEPNEEGDEGGYYEERGYGMKYGNL